MEPKILGVLCCLPDVLQKPRAKASLDTRLIHYPKYKVQEVSKTKQTNVSLIFIVREINLYRNAEPKGDLET